MNNHTQTLLGWSSTPANALWKEGVEWGERAEGRYWRGKGMWHLKITRGNQSTAFSWIKLLSLESQQSESAACVWGAGNSINNNPCPQDQDRSKAVPQPSPPTSRTHSPRPPPAIFCTRKNSLSPLSRCQQGLGRKGGRLALRSNSKVS